MKQALIKEILELKNEAISYGFDWPTENPENATTEELEAFLKEVLVYLVEAGII
jgi:predicted TIM-barrel fold metal-dependent hydrolase